MLQLFGLSHFTVAAGVLSLAAIGMGLIRKRKRKFSFRGKTVWITGASSGLGLALAEELALLGSNLVLTARNCENLESAAQRVSRANGEVSVQTVPLDVTDWSGVLAAFGAVQLVRPVDVLVCCAGSSAPGTFLDLPVEAFEAGMRLNYFGSLYCAKAFLASSSERRKKIVFVSSTAGLVSFYGYSAYAPTKHALRSLADCLRQELDVAARGAVETHVYFPSTIETPGYQREQQTKPQITRAIEGGECSDASPKARARVLLRGLEQNSFFVCSDWVTELFKSASLGASPHDRFFLADWILGAVAAVVLPLWRAYVEAFLIRK